MSSESLVSNFLQTSEIERSTTIVNQVELPLSDVHMYMYDGAISSLFGGSTQVCKPVQ